MNEHNLEQAYLKLEKESSRIITLTIEKHYQVNYPKIDYTATSGIETYSDLKQILEDFEFYLGSPSIITASISAPPEDYLGVIYTAYERNYIDRRLAEAMIASKMTYIPDILKLHNQGTGEIIYEAPLLEIAKACKEQRQTDPLYKENFIESCQRFLQTEPCLRYQSQLKSEGVPFSDTSLGIEEEKICLRIDNLDVLDNEFDVDLFKNTSLTHPFSLAIDIKKDTSTIEFSLAVLQKLNSLLPEHKNKSVIRNTNYSCVNFQSYLRDCLASQKVITEYNRDENLCKKFYRARAEYVFGFDEIENKIRDALRKKYKKSSENKQYSIVDLKTDLQENYIEFKQACLHNMESSLSGISLVEAFCKKALSEKSLIRTDEFILFLEKIKQVAVKYDPQDIRLYVVDNQPYLYGTKKSDQNEVKNQSPLLVNPFFEKEVANINYSLPDIPKNNQIDSGSIPQRLNVGQQGVICQQANNHSSTSSTTPDSLKEKVTNNIDHAHYEGYYTTEIAELDREITENISQLNTRLKTASIHKCYSEKEYLELDDFFNLINSKINFLNKKIIDRSKLEIPTYGKRFAAASKLTKNNDYNRDLIKTAIIKIEHFLDNIAVVSCHPILTSEMHYALIWKAQKSGYITKQLADLLLSTRYKKLYCKYKPFSDNNGVIRKGSFLEIAKCCYLELSSSKIDSEREEFEKNYAQFEKLDCFQSDKKSALIIDRFHNLQTKDSSSEEKVLHTNEMTEYLALQYSGSQKMSVTSVSGQNTKSNFVSLNTIELELFDELLRECEEINNSRLRYHWQINLRELMKAVSSLLKSKHDESNQPSFRALMYKDPEDKCYSTILNMMGKAKITLEYLFRGEWFSHGSFIDYSNPHSIHNGFNEQIKEYEQTNQQKKRCQLYGDELIDEFIIVSCKKIEEYYQQAEKEQKRNYEELKSELNRFQRKKRRILKNQKESNIAQLQTDCQIKKDCILKIKESAKQHGPENIFFHLYPLPVPFVELCQDDLPNERLGYFIRQQKIKPEEDSSETIKKELSFNSKGEKADDCKLLEKKCDRLSGCSFWEAPISVSKEDDSLVEKSFEASRSRAPMSEQSCSSK